MAKKLTHFTVSDMITEELAQSAESLKDSRYEGIQTIPGESRQGEMYLEFYPDEEALKATVVQLFFEPLADF